MNNEWELVHASDKARFGIALTREQYRGWQKAAVFTWVSGLLPEPTVVALMDYLLDECRKQAGERMAQDVLNFTNDYQAWLEEVEAL